jgi:hypothetical protein
MTPSAALEALDMLEPLFFFYLLELLFVWATISKMTHFMAPIAHEMRELFSLLLSFALCHLLLEAKATFVTIVSLSLQYMLKGDF